MIKRKVEQELKTLARQYRVLTVLGPRQAGKSTLCRAVFPEKPWVNLEEPETRAFAQSDPKGLLGRYPEGCFIDEIQRCPELLSYIQVIVDERKTPGHFILSGSQQVLLMDTVSQSLAGRTAIVKLLPLSFEEAGPVVEPSGLDQMLYRGGYPEIVEKDLTPTQALSFYVQTYLERDVRQLQAVRDLSLFQNFLRLLAGRSGNLLNYASIGNDLGISEGTVKNWISVAEASFVIYRLGPYFRNFGKRQIKSPKIYFFDTGLLCYLLGINSSDQLRSHPLRGAIFETYIVSECVKYLWNRVRESNLYFYADKVIEIDLIAETSSGPVPIEVKSAATFRRDMLQHIEKAYSRLPGLSEKSAIVFAGESSGEISGTDLISVSDLNLLGQIVTS